MDLKIYHMAGACSLATLLALEQSGHDYSVLSPFAGERQKSADFLAATPTGQVPCLLVDGRPLTENSAILLFLARAFPDQALLPLSGDPFHDARIESDLIFCSAGVHPWVRQLLAPHYFMDDRSQWERVRSLGRMKLHERLSILNTRLRPDCWFYGDWSVIDGYIFWLTMHAVLEGVEQSGIELCIANAIRMLTRPALLGVLRRTDAIQPRDDATGDASTRWMGRPSPRPFINRFCEATAQPLLPA